MRQPNRTAHDSATPTSRRATPRRRSVARTASQRSTPIRPAFSPLPTPPIRSAGTTLESDTPRPAPGVGIADRPDQPLPAGRKLAVEPNSIPRATTVRPQNLAPHLILQCQPVESVAFGNFAGRNKQSLPIGQLGNPFDPIGSRHVGLGRRRLGHGGPFGCP